VPRGVPERRRGRASDRWVAIACWTDDEWATLAAEIGSGSGLASSMRGSPASTTWRPPSRVDEARSRLEVADRLQSLGIEAVPVADFGDIYDDQQVKHRDHFVPLTHAAMGPRMYEHNGFRVSGCAAGYDRAGPLLGQDNDWVQTELLGLTDDEREKLAEDGVFK
jgi:crotonobetainyl-CoA:carnitine CoA-transferase CaiB-like acyl-CoA transferase